MMGTVDIDGIYIHETERALCFEVDGRKLWLPKSQILNITRCGKDDIELVIPEWLAMQEELI